MDHSRPGRFQFSIRSLLFLTAAAALLLVPVAWVARERRQMVLAQHGILEAREVALRSVVREQARRDHALSSPPARLAAAGTGAIEHLKRENAELQRQVKELHRELERLRDSPERAGTPGR